MLFGDRVVTKNIDLSNAFANSMTFGDKVALKMPKLDERLC